MNEFCIVQHFDRIIFHLDMKSLEVQTFWEEKTFLDEMKRPEFHLLLNRVEIALIHSKFKHNLLKH